MQIFRFEVSSVIQEAVLLLGHYFSTSEVKSEHNLNNQVRQ
jgi:hypothetical protein